MLVVIFRATINQLDAEYSATAERMRDLALTEFGCLAFHSISEGSEEITLSYWPDDASIRRWRAHPEHLEAQRTGKDRWYESYSVDVAKVERAYRMLPQSNGF